MTMQQQLEKKLCDDMLKAGLISENTKEDKDRFELIVQDLLGCFPKYLNGDRASMNNLKKKIGKLLASRAKSLKINQQNLKTLKKLVFDVINEKIISRKIHKRKLKIGKNRQIYSSDQSSSEAHLKQEPKIQQKNEQQINAQSDYNQQKTNGQAKIDSNKQQPVKKYEEQEQQMQQTGVMMKKSIKQPKISKRKYKCYDHDFKQEVCQYASDNGIEATQKKYGLSVRKITSWLQSYKLNILGKGRKALDPAMQFNMSIWLLKKIWNLVPLTQKIIRQKAATMKSPGNKFNGSKGWLQKFFLRHVEIKSCFDFRNKIETRQQCAKYHWSAYVRLLQDHQNLLKLSNKFQIINKDFEQIIYGDQTHPLLKSNQDKHLDKLKSGSQVLYDYQKLKNLSTLPITDKRIKFQQKYEEDYQNQNDVRSQQSEAEYQDDSEYEQEISQQIIKDQQSDVSSKQEQIEDIYEESDAEDKHQVVKDENQDDE